MSSHAMTHVSVTLSTGSGYLLALIDRLACDRLNLKTGMRVRAGIRHANILS